MHSGVHHDALLCSDCNSCACVLSFLNIRRSDSDCQGGTASTCSGDCVSAPTQACQCHQGRQGMTHLHRCAKRSRKKPETDALFHSSFSAQGNNRRCTQDGMLYSVLLWPATMHTNAGTPSRQGHHPNGTTVPEAHCYKLMHSTVMPSSEESKNVVQQQRSMTVPLGPTCKAGVAAGCPAAAVLAHHADDDQLALGRQRINTGGKHVATN